MKENKFFTQETDKKDFIKNVKRNLKILNKDEKTTIRYFIEKLQYNEISEEQLAQMIYILNKNKLNEIIPENLFKQLFPPFEDSEVKEKLLERLKKELRDIENTPDNILKKNAYLKLKELINYIENKNVEKIWEIINNSNINLINLVHKRNNEWYFNRHVFLSELKEIMNNEMINEKQENDIEFTIL